MMELENQIRRRLALAEANRRGLALPAARPSTDRPLIPQAPTEKQAAFLALDCKEAFYGGAAGGGKSSALLMAALQHTDQKGYAALLLRRTFADLALPGALMDRANGWLRGTAARWNERDKTWCFPSGATLTFGYLETEADKYRYQGAEFSFIGFDEATQFSESQYTYLFSRLRKLEGVAYPLRMRAASNPGGLGHAWVRQRFIVEGEAAGRVFIPARLEDNPYLDAATYEASLQELDHITRLQLREGDWEVRADGLLFRRDWFEVVDAAPAACEWVRFWDLAATEEKAGHDPDYLAGVLMGRAPGGVYYVADVAHERLTPGGVERLIRQKAEIDGRRVTVGIEQEPGSSGKMVIARYRQLLDGWPFYGEPSTGSKSDRARPLSSQAEAGNVKLVRGPWIGPFLDELAAFPTAGVHDDMVDAATSAFARLALGRRPAAPSFGGVTRPL